MKFGFDSGPVGGAKRDSSEFHGGLGRQLTWLDPIQLTPSAIGPTDPWALWDTGAGTCHPAAPVCLDARQLQPRWRVVDRLVLPPRNFMHFIARPGE